MKGEDPDKLAEINRLVRKLGELAEVLENVSTKMRLAVEKQKISIEHLGMPNGEGTRALDELQERLGRIESVPVANIRIDAARQLSEELIECDPVSHTPISKMTYHEYVEFSCLDEYRKFRNLPAISPEEIQLCDVENLCDRFASEY